MVDQYWRKIESVENDIENSIQISGILLKLKGYDEKLSDLGKISTNTGAISTNLTKIDNIENDIAIKNRNDIYNKTFVISNISTNENSDLIADIYILIQNLLQMELLKLMQFIIILMIKLIILVMCIIFIVMVKNLKELY